MTWLKKYNTIEEWNAAKSNLKYQSVGLVGDYSVVYMPPIIHTLPIKAVFYDSATSSFIKMSPDEITEAVPTYTPIGVEVIPAEHNVYGTGQSGVMSLAEMNGDKPDTGGSRYWGICWGGYGTDTSLPNYNYVNYIGRYGNLHNGVVQGTTGIAYLPSDQFSTMTGLDGKSNYSNSGSDWYLAPSPFNANGSRNEAYYTTDYSTENPLSDFDGVGNTKVLTDLAVAQSDWKTAITITNSKDAGYYPAACCAWRFHTEGTDQGQWYLPACGELGYVINRISAINTTINKVLKVYSSVTAVAVGIDKSYLSSSELGEYDARLLLAGYGLVGLAGKNNYYCARAFIRL